MLAAFTTGYFLKPTEIFVKDCHTQITEISNYIQIQPSTVTKVPLTDAQMHRDAQRRRIFFKTL